MKLCLWLWVLWLVINYAVSAQPFTSRTLSLSQGLPEYYVSGLVQDKAGFIWVATRDGLARYDGRQFKVFRHQPFSNHSLASNVILSLQSVSDTTMLIYLEGGALQVFNPITERFRKLVSADMLHQRQLKLDNPILSIDEKYVWGRNGTQFSHYDRQTRQVKAYPYPTRTDTGRYPPITPLPASQQLLRALPGRLIQFNTQTRSFRTWDHPLIGQPGQIETYYGTQVLRRASGEVLISAAQQLLVLNPVTRQFRSIPITSPVNTQAGLLYESPDGQVYLTHGMSVYRLSADDQLTILWTAPRIDYQNYFHALLLDRSGVLWIGTNGDGIQQVDLRALPIKAYPYRTNFVYDVLSQLGIAPPDWATTNRYVYDLRWGGTVPYVTIGLPDCYELLRVEPGEHRLRSLLKLPQTKLVEKIKGGNAIRRLFNGTLWLFDPHQGLLKVDSTGRLRERFSWPESIDWVSSIQPIGNQMWVGSQESGLYAFDLKARRMVRHLRYQSDNPGSILSDQVLCLTADPIEPAVLWLGTQEGLSRLDTRTMRFRHWTQNEGLPSPTINTLLVDRRGNLWFSTGTGISRMNPKTFQLRHFTTADGLQDIEYRQNHAVQLPDGRLAYGGATGVTIFDPLALSEQAQPIPTVLTGLRLGNVPMEPRTPGSPLTQPLNATPSLQLQYTQNFLGLEFAGLQYNKPTSIQYRYQLSGVDGDWVYAGNQTLANYTELDPGTYTFRVNAADALGHWSPLVKTLRITITPPWWQTWWFYGLVVLITVSTLYGLYRYRLAQVLKLQHLRNDIARDLHDEVGSSLSTIAIYSKIALEQVGASSAKSEPLLQKITEQTRDMMGSMNDIVWSINTKNDDFDKVFVRMREHAYQLLEAKGYTLHFDFDENLHRTRLAMEKRRDLYLLYKEALNNIAKYAGGRTVWIQIQLHNGTIELLIRDDGKGFEFNQAASQGNGLRNMNERAAALKGTLRIDSQPGQGTTLHLRF